MSRPRIRRSWLVLVGLSLAATACSARSPASSAQPSGGPAVAETAAAVPATTPSAVPPLMASATPASSQPPAASLIVEGGDPVAGQLGSYTWAGGGSDSPWLPGADVALAAGEPITVALDPAIPIADWTASRVDAGVVDGTGAIALGSGSGSIAFSGPEAETGSWSVQVDVHFADDLGSAAYYWRLTIE